MNKLKSTAILQSVTISLIPIFLMPLPAHSKSDYPVRAVRIVVPYPPGGTTDYVARILADGLTKKTGQSFVVQNKSGATGTIGAADVLRSPADGYTLLMIDTTFALLPSMFKSLEWNARTDFVPVALGATTPVAMVVSADSPFKSLQQLIDETKLKPGKFNYAGGGYGGSTHLAFEMFKEQVGTNLTNVPYKGAGESVIGLLNGSVSTLIAAVPSVIGQLNNKKLRALAVSGDQRMNILPNVPTFKESGAPGYDAIFWFGLAAPKGTPPNVVERLNKLAVAVLSNKDVSHNLSELGAERASMSPEQFREFIRKDMDRWGNVAQKAGLKSH